MAAWRSGLSCQPEQRPQTLAGEKFPGASWGRRLLTQTLVDSLLLGETRVRPVAQIPVISLSPPGGSSGFSLNIRSSLTLGARFGDVYFSLLEKFLS